MCQALFHIRVPTLSSSLIPGGHNNQKGQTTTIADCISIVTAIVFLTCAKHLGFGTTKRATATNQSRFCVTVSSLPKCGGQAFDSPKMFRIGLGMVALGHHGSSCQCCDTCSLEESLIESWQTSKEMVKVGIMMGL